VKLDDLPPVPGVRHRTVNVNGVGLHVAEAGDGPPLLLVHGWPQHWWIWRHLIPPLAQRFRVLAPDLRGMGWSDAPPGDYAKSTFAADLLALMDAEGIDRARIIGHDWGGYASFLLAHDHPERVERMVGLDIPPPWRTPPHPAQLLLPFLLAYQLPIVLPGLGRWLMTSGRYVPWILRFGSGSAKTWSDEEVRAYTEPLRDPARARASVQIYRTFQRRELLAQLRRRGPVRVPALLLMGGESVFRLVVGDPGLPVEAVEGSGHFLAEEAPDRVLERALPFLEGTA
jgi:pimeloyl-ACP methyl ester carboxylesterase